MKRLVPVVALVTFVGLVPVATATTPVPTRSTSTIPTIVSLAGFAPGDVVDPRCETVFIVRDALNNPLPNSVVMIDFSACVAGEVRIGSQPMFPGLFVNCSARTVAAITNAFGIATFRIVGASNLSTGSEPAVGDGCAAVIADGIILGSVSVATPDFNGASGPPLALGIDGLDTALFSKARYSSYRSTANLVGPAGTIDGQDTVLFASFRFGQGSVTNGPFCP